MSLKPVDLSTWISPAGHAGLHVEATDDGHGRIGRARAAIAIGKVQRAVGDVAAERLVQHQRRRAVAPLRAGILDADPPRRVHRSVVVEERDPRVVRLHVLADAAIRDDDDAAHGIVGTALGGIDGAVDLDVRRNRIERAVGCGIGRQAEAIADDVGLGTSCRGGRRLLRHRPRREHECEKSRRERQYTQRSGHLSS